MLLRLLIHWLTLAFALYLISLITPLGITYDNHRSLLYAALALIIANTIIKPILILISLPLVILTLGLFIWIINAIILYTLPQFVHGFHVPSFFSAFCGALLLSLITGLFSGWERTSRQPARTSRGNGEVIDV